MSRARRDPAGDAALRASLIGHARQLIARNGASALTMRALASDAGCAVGLPYNVFADRHELVVEVLAAEFAGLHDAYVELIDRVGSNTVAKNLSWFANLLLGSPAVALAGEVIADERLSKAVADRAHKDGVGPAEFATVIAGYLEAEQRAGRVAREIDATAFGFLLAGAIHNLIVSGEAWPRPTPAALRRHLTAVANAIEPRVRLPAHA